MQTLSGSEKKIDDWQIAIATSFAILKLLPSDDLMAAASDYKENYKL